MGCHIFQDVLPDTPFEENPLFIKKLMPKGEILSAIDTSNRLLWYMEYATINVEVSQIYWKKNN